MATKNAFEWGGTYVSDPSIRAERVGIRRAIIAEREKRIIMSEFLF